ncbi:hypothetical protein K438DRAFT_1966502 [Mycena galopus ATCC 62051]|nr:hypothetical protein K438DRAFT_1966502 [Mycena galopus ATCC 62051]
MSAHARTHAPFRFRSILILSFSMALSLSSSTTFVTSFSPSSVTCPSHPGHRDYTLRTFLHLPAAYPYSFLRIATTRMHSALEEAKEGSGEGKGKRWERMRAEA